MLKYWHNNTRKNQIIKAVNCWMRTWLMIRALFGIHSVKIIYSQMMNMSYLLQIRRLMIIVFHMRNISYDNFDDVEKLIEFIKNGE